MQTNNSGTNYTVIVTNTAGSVTSSNAVLTVTNIPPAITVQPTNQTVAVGSNATFAVTATGTEPLSYQWQVNETNLVDEDGIISGSTNTILTIINAQTNNSGNYTVIVTNIAGSVTSSNAILTVTNILSGITVQPTNQTVGMGPTVKSGINATGTILGIGSIIRSGDGSGNFILSGGGGTSNGTYYVLTSSNPLAPLNLWTSIATNQFDGNGYFIFTNAAQTNAAQQFYLLQMP